MSGRLWIVENESWRRLDASRQHHVESALCLVAGARTGKVPSFLEAIKSEASGVYIFPVLLPSEELRAPALVRALEKATPFARPFGLALLLVGDERFIPDTLQDAFWVDVLDNLYDISVPTAVTIWHKGNAAVEGFQLAAQVSSLFREIESLGELARLAGVLGALETRVAEQEDDVRRASSPGGDST